MYLNVEKLSDNIFINYLPRGNHVRINSPAILPKAAPLLKFGINDPLGIGKEEPITEKKNWKKGYIISNSCVILYGLTWKAKYINRLAYIPVYGVLQLFTTFSWETVKFSLVQEKLLNRFMTCAPPGTSEAKNWPAPGGNVNDATIKIIMAG